MNIGIFGGTFDPFHIGHLSVVNACVESLFFDKIYVVPSFNPPHKVSENISLFSYRFEMARIALDNLKSSTGIVLSDIETEEDGFSYTLNTVRKLNSKNSKNKGLYLICGSDVIYELHKWHKPDLLLKEIGLFIVKRPGYNDSNLEKHIKSVKETYDATIVFAKSEMLDISSEIIRKNLKNNTALADCDLTENVIEFIANNRIYDENYALIGLKKETLKQIVCFEKILRKNLTSKRLIHSLNTMRESVRLAKMFNADIDKCAIAGILHDCAKYSGAEKLYRELICKEQAKVQETLNDAIKIPDKILHAYWAKTLAREVYGINDKDILDAIYYHTTSRKNPSLIEKIIFVADKIEPERKFPRIDKIRKITYEDLDTGYYECLKDIIKVLEINEAIIHNDTIEAFKFLKDERRK